MARMKTPTPAAAGTVARRATPQVAAALATLFTIATSAHAQFCLENPPALTPLGSPSGCDQCLYNALPGALEAHPATSYYVLSDLPETFTSTGVLYATTPVLPADRSGNPILAMRTQVTTGGFSTLDDSFDVLLWHTSSPSDGSAPRRIVVYVRNDGTGPVLLTPRQVVTTDGTYHGMSNTLGQRMLANDWNTKVAPLTLAPGTGDVVGYGKRFAAATNTSDTSTNPNCFGRVRVTVQNSDPLNHPTHLTAYVIAIGSANASQNKTLAEALLTTGATNGDPFDLNTAPSGCEVRRATGTFETFIWRAQTPTLDVASLPAGGQKFRMALWQNGSQSCPLGRQTADLVLRPGFVRADTIGNYMVDYRVTFRFINRSATAPQAVDLRFGRTSADIALAWQVSTGASAPTDATVDACPVRVAWAGSNQPTLDYSLLTSDGGPLVIPPCGERCVAVHFLILGGSSLPFDISVLPATPTEYVVDNLDAGFAVTGTWATSTQSGFYGSNSVVHIGNNGLDSATWSPALVSAGHYDVYAWWTAASNRATAAPYDIFTLTGTTRVLANQQTSGGQWNLLGSFALPAGLSPVVRLTDAVPTSQYVSADAVRLVLNSPIQCIVDNRDAGCTTVGTWPTSANSGYWGTDSQYHAGDGGAARCTWTPSLPYAGRYRVYGWWIAASNRGVAPYTINHARGVTTVYADQADLSTAQTWNWLGDYDFNAGTTGSVVLTSAVPAGLYVSADAIRWDYLTPPDTTPPGAPTGLAGVGASGQVSLTWNSGGAADLAGYHVYRATLPGGSYARLNPAPLPTADYSDNTVINCTTYEYVVTAVDASGNESAYSAAWTARPPTPGRPGDLDGDGLITADDLVTFAGCLLGPGPAIPTGCTAADDDCDGDADLLDYAALQSRLGV